MKSRKKTTLKDVIKAAREAGAKVTVGLDEIPRMPLHIAGDPEVVTALLNQSERMTKQGNAWSATKNPNAIACGLCLQLGWAYAASAAWLRCFLKGELTVKPKGWKP